MSRRLDTNRTQGADRVGGLRRKEMTIYDLLKKIYNDGNNCYFISNGLTRSERKLMREYDALFQTDGKTYVSLTSAGCDAARKL